MVDLTSGVAEAENAMLMKVQEEYSAFSSADYMMSKYLPF